MHLGRVAQVIKRCIDNAGLFEGNTAGEGLCEIEVVNKNHNHWLVCAKGITELEAKTYFPHQHKKAERAQTTVRVYGGGEASFLFVMRPIERITTEHLLELPITSLAPGDNIPFVVIYKAYLKIKDMPQNNANLTNLRWDFDLESAKNHPKEKWMNEWWNIVSFNPAHAPSHLHINSEDTHEAEYDRDSYRLNELRLAIGVPNPILIIMSLAAWIRSQF